MDKPKIPERILKIGLFELWGTKREEPNEFTELAKAGENFKKVFLKTYIEPVLKWLTKLTNSQ